MTKMIAYCGLNCAECPAFIATQKDDDNKRKKVALEWQKRFNINIKPQEINCDGCTSQSIRLINFCQRNKIRLCAIENQVQNCAYCPAYACEKLIEFFKWVPECKIILDDIKKS